MNVVSLKDYAAQKNISYEAVRQQVVRYKDELGSHVIRDGRQQFLDEEAVAFLDAKRQKNPVAIIQQSKDEAIEDLRQERELLLRKIAAQADEISKLAQWKADNAMLIAGAEQTKMLLDTAQRDVKLLEGFVADAKAEVLKAQEDAYKAECMVTQLQMENLELIDKEVGLQAEVAAKKALEDEIHLLQQENEQLRSRTFGDYLKGWFRKGPRA